MGQIKDKIVASFAKRLQKNFSVERLILFGSRAGQTHLNDSDYDFLIVSRDFEKIGFLERIPLVIRKTKSFFSADFLCYTPKEFLAKQKHIGIVSTAIQSGVRII
ncbi:MAG: nucleotidyltransferase domain-containing protein [Candidatus Micrarchaeota archaeon]